MSIDCYKRQLECIIDHKSHFNDEDWKIAQCASQIYQLCDSSNKEDFISYCNDNMIPLDTARHSYNILQIFKPNINYAALFFPSDTYRDSLAYKAEMKDIPLMVKLQHYLELAKLDSTYNTPAFKNDGYIGDLIKIADCYREMKRYIDEQTYLTKAYTIISREKTLLNAYTTNKILKQLVYNAIIQKQYSKALQYEKYIGDLNTMRYGFNETNFFYVVDKLVKTSNKYYVVSRIDTSWSGEVYNLAEHLIREAYIYYELDQYDKSIERCYLSDSIIKTYSNFAPYQLDAIKYNVQKDCILAKCFFAKHEEIEALSALQIAFNKFVDFYWDVSVLPKGEKYKTVYSETDRETALKRYDDLRDLIYKSTYLSDSYIYNRLCYNQCLLEKQILLETSSFIKKMALKTNNIHYFNILKHQKELEGYHNIFSIDSIENLIAQEERLLLYELADSISTSGKRSLVYEMSDIVDRLSSELAIEFFTVTISEDSTMYCALLLRHDSEYPELISLFEEKEVSSVISSSEGNITNQTYDFYSNGDSISQLVWSKILPYVKHGETIYFAPSGLLHQLAIEYLPYDENRTMSDVYNMVRVSSTREIVLNKQHAEYTTATIYGGIAYDLEEDVLLAESENYATENLLASRSIENDTLNRGNVKYLPGTKKEAESIYALLKQNNISAKLYTTAKANEESFKALSGKHNNILHIGTHGFTWTDSVAKKQDFFTQRVQLMGQEQHYDTSIDPLNRCGLLFAGANIALQGNSRNLPEGVQDGILTAKEISLMDLRDANLVVLSACETAKGDITSEGVFGLQRAFKMAGVQTIIMSLWRVNDQATQLLMTEFYNNWIGKHQSKRDAFRNAQNTVRAQYEEPVYWAGFIMLD